MSELAALYERASHSAGFLAVDLRELYQCEPAHEIRKVIAELGDAAVKADKWLHKMTNRNQLQKQPAAKRTARQSA
jgi:hypothetical protein